MAGQGVFAPIYPYDLRTISASQYAASAGTTPVAQPIIDFTTQGLPRSYQIERLMFEITGILTDATGTSPILSFNDEGQRKSFYDRLINQIQWGATNVGANLISLMSFSDLIEIIENAFGNVPMTNLPKNGATGMTTVGGTFPFTLQVEIPFGLPHHNPLRGAFGPMAGMLTDQGIQYYLQGTDPSNPITLGGVSWFVDQFECKVYTYGRQSSQMLITSPLKYDIKSTNSNDDITVNRGLCLYLGVLNMSADEAWLYGTHGGIELRDGDRYLTRRPTYDPKQQKNLAVNGWFDPSVLKYWLDTNAIGGESELRRPGFPIVFTGHNAIAEELTEIQSGRLKFDDGYPTSKKIGSVRVEPISSVKAPYGFASETKSFVPPGLKITAPPAWLLAYMPRPISES